MMAPNARSSENSCAFWLTNRQWRPARNRRDKKNMRCQIIVHRKCCSFTTMRQLRARIQNCSLLACGASIDARAAAVVLIISAESLLLLLQEEQAWL
jgi:hypothetical protein